MFFVQYDDGDEEHVSLTELMDLLSQKQQAVGQRTQQPRLLKNQYSERNKKASKNDSLLHRWVMAEFLDGYLCGFVHHIVSDPAASSFSAVQNADKKYLVVYQDGAIEILPPAVVKEMVKRFHRHNKEPSALYDKWFANLPNVYKELIGRQVVVSMSFDGSKFGVDSCRDLPRQEKRFKRGVVTRIDLYQHRGELEAKIMQESEERALFFVLYECGDREHFNFEEIQMVLDKNY